MTARLKSVAILFAAMLCSVTGSAAATFTGMVVIGDSLSDQGNAFSISSSILPFPVPPLEYTDGTSVGRFTNGRNYIDYLSSTLGLTVFPSLAGGSNYATGGARTDSASIGGFPIGPFSLLDQRDAYLDSLTGEADPGALHVVWGGSNDLTDIVEAVIADPGFNPFPEIENAVNDIADIVESLAVANAKSILVPNVPNLGLVPLITAGGPPVPEASVLSSLFNTDLATAMDDLSDLYPDTDLIEFDVFSLLTDAFLDPAAFGFTNVTDACYSLLGLPGGTTCANPDEYLSWDGFHPTTATHSILAANMAVPLPAALWLFATGMVSLLGLAYHRRA